MRNIVSNAGLKGNLWSIAVAVTAVLALAFSLMRDVRSLGTSNGTLEQKVSDNSAAIEQLMQNKEDRSAAESDRRGEMDLIRSIQQEGQTISAQEQQLYQLVLSQGKHQ